MIDEIQQFFMLNKVRADKYNYSVDGQDLQTQSCPVYFQISEDFKRLKIVKKVPVEQPQHLLQMNEAEKLIEKKKFFQENMNKVASKFEHIQMTKE